MSPKARFETHQMAEDLGLESRSKYDKTYGSHRVYVRPLASFDRQTVATAVAYRRILASPLSCVAAGRDAVRRLLCVRCSPISK